MNESQNHGGIPATCERAVPLWLVLLDNVPTGVLYGLGALLLYPLGWIWSSLYLLYSAGSIVFFWLRICPYCPHFATRACPCGYGILAPSLTQKQSGEPADFRNIFRRNIVAVFPSWFVPAGVGLYLLIQGYSPQRAIIFAAFCVVGFAFIPLISKFVGCRNCTVRQNCPWMT